MRLFGISRLSGPLSRQETIKLTLGFFGCYLVFVALVICVVAGRTSLRLHTIKTTWPTVQAEVLGCGQVSGHRIRSGAIPQATQCHFEYSVDGKLYKATTSTLFTARPSKNAPQWIADHPPGSHMTLYYSPGRPANVSMGGADAAIDSEEPTHFFHYAGFFAIGGFALIGISFAVRQSGELQ